MSTSALRVPRLRPPVPSRHFLGAILKGGGQPQQQQQRWQRVVPHQIGTIYRAVAEVERYSEFLPWCVSSRVHNRSLDEHGAGELRTEIKVGFDLVQSQFSSLVSLTPLRRVHAVSEPNEHVENLTFTWEFAELGEPERPSCRLDLSLDFRLRNAEHMLMWELVHDKVISEYVRCFQRRCVVLEAAVGGAAANAGASGGDTPKGAGSGGRE